MHLEPLEYSGLVLCDSFISPSDFFFIWSFLCTLQDRDSLLFLLGERQEGIFAHMLDILSYMHELCQLTMVCCWECSQGFRWFEDDISFQELCLNLNLMEGWNLGWLIMCYPLSQSLYCLFTNSVHRCGPDATPYSIKHCRFLFGYFWQGSFEWLYLDYSKNSKNYSM